MRAEKKSDEEITDYVRDQLFRLDPDGVTRALNGGEQGLGPVKSVTSENVEARVNAVKYCCGLGAVLLMWPCCCGQDSASE